MAGETRNLSSSLEYRLFQILHQEGWSNSEEKQPLIKLGDPFPANSWGLESGGYPWVWWDANVKNPSRAHITVYRNGLPVSPSSYNVNFRDGCITFKTATTGMISADLTWFTVNVLEGYPEEEVLKMTQLPIVAHTVDSKNGSPFSIGTSACEWGYPVTIDILGRSAGEIKDLMDSIAENIRHVPLLDCSDAYLLREDGDVDANFSFDLQFMNYMRPDPYPRARVIQPRQNGSDKERHRAIITFGLKNVH